MRQAFMTIRLSVDDDEGIDPVHLCEEVQAYCNTHTKSKVDGYIFEYDKFIPFHAQEEY
tara:strand:+ start:195 stop:371 length:177 start_codon:yes stop_codon:yes gene_type:complete